MRRYIVLVNWNDGKGSEIEVIAKNKRDAINNALDSIHNVRDHVYSYRLLKWFHKGE